MSPGSYLARQAAQIRRGGRPVVKAKLRAAFRLALRALMMAPAALAVAVVRGIRPWLLVRFNRLSDTELGHLAGDTELYLCEREARIEVPALRHVDIVHTSGLPVCNQQLLRMWQRTIRVWPGWLVEPISWLNDQIAGGAAHRATSSSLDRDIHNLLDRYPPRLAFTPDEQQWGEAQLRAMGVPPGARYVCLIVRDRAYDESRAYYEGAATNLHSYRNCDVQRFVLAAEELAARGYWVIRMGAAVVEPIRSRHPRVIDYATNGMRTDFMDVYLGATCTFCLSTATGFDTIPMIFRRPIATANHVPITAIGTYSERCLSLTKRHYATPGDRELSLREIVASGVAAAVDDEVFHACGVRLVENTPEEVRDLAVEMSDRLNGSWRSQPEDAALQQRFWSLYPKDLSYLGSSEKLHGVIRGGYGAAFLRNNPSWLR